ncbi:hypothetical protein L615_004400000150 [Nocardioides sp. J9]|uniref:hypothetical protein n=1 Tax=Nocardioides sp. J9 TaxID=935844 RepID=UPI0011A208BA|nr:hypothetical protein [Nocardioides sp. J9]TWG96251.1 hypothetical protein L615_004400000150 [Nocardioides sp. J9]
MTQHRRRRRAAPTSRHLRRLGATVLATTVVATLVSAGAGLGPASAGTTVSPAEPGDPPVVRGDSVTIDVDRVAMHHARTAATQNFAPAPASTVALTGCRGDNPNGTNASPRTEVTVTAPDGSTVLSRVSPVRDLGLLPFLTSPPNQPLDPQPGPANANYRGDFSGNAHHGMNVDVSLAGEPAGVYTVTTTDHNTVKTGLGACSFATPETLGTGFGKNVTPGPVVTTETFEYRPWAAQFVDVLGKGAVRANIEPAEYEVAVGSKTSPLYDGDLPLAGTGRNQQFYGLQGAFALPNNPQACLDDLTACLPSRAYPCQPSFGCTPRLMIIDRPATAADPNGLVGVFDLDTRAFVAHATVDGTTRTLLSLGTTNDGYYRDLLQKLAAGAAAQGVDLASILATEVRVGTGDQQVSLSLLNGLQVDPSTKPGGVQIASDATVQAGVVLDIYSSLRLTGGACATNSASSDSAPDRFTPNEDHGYTVTRSDLLPEVPRVGPLGAVVGGPLYHVTGRFRSDALVNTATAVLGVDTAVDEPNGYPVWVNPFLSGVSTVEPRTMDFLGTGTWSASETLVGAGCLVVDFLLGTGVAVYNNPLPVGLGTVFDPLATPSPAAERLTDAIDQAVDDVVGQLSTNPVVSSLLTQVTALLPLS